MQAVEKPCTTRLNQISNLSEKYLLTVIGCTLVLLQNTGQPDLELALEEEGPCVPQC